MLYGDYDVDGMTGLAILYRALKMLSANVDFYIPHRIEEGYGLNGEAVASLAGAGRNCWSRSIAASPPSKASERPTRWA